jgi:hypothetical protein
MVVEVMEVVMEAIVGEMVMAMPLAAAPSMTAIPPALGEMPTSHWTGEVTAAHWTGEVAATHVATETTTHWTGEVTAAHMAATETATHVAATTAETSATTAVTSVRFLHGGRSKKQATCKNRNCNNYSRFHDEPPKLLACPGQADFLRCQSEGKTQVASGTRVKRSRNEYRWPLLIVDTTTEPEKTRHRNAYRP